jgi:hypothetical protein
MPGTGKLEKMLILAFSDSEKAENGGVNDADDQFEALINPESYTLQYKLKFSQGAQGQGTSGAQLKYEYTEPEEITFDFLFDNTGIIDGQPRESVVDDLKKMKDVLIGYKGDSHEPRHLKLVWGENSIFKGRVTELSINHKMFKPDLTHIRKVKQGDTLPLMCYSIYGDPKYYLQVAEVNGLANFRQLKPGSDLFFPPLKKIK